MCRGSGDNIFFDSLNLNDCKLEISLICPRKSLNPLRVIPTFTHLFSSYIKIGLYTNKIECEKVNLGPCDPGCAADFRNGKFKPLFLRYISAFCLHSAQIVDFHGT